MTVRHFQDRCVAQIQFVLPSSPFTLGALDRDSRATEMSTSGGVQRLLTRSLQDVVVLQIRRGCRQSPKATAVSAAIRFLEDEILQLRAGQSVKACDASRFNLQFEQRARRVG